MFIRPVRKNRAFFHFMENFVPVKQKHPAGRNPLPDGLLLLRHTKIESCCEEKAADETRLEEFVSCTRKCLRI